MKKALIGQAARTWMVLAAIVMSAQPVWSQETRPADGAKAPAGGIADTALSVKWSRESVDKLLTRMSELATKLAKTDPEAAKAIANAVKVAQEADIGGNMDAVVRELAGSLDKAHLKQQDVATAIELVLKALRDEDAADDKEYIEFLKAVRERLAAARDQQLKLLEEAREGKEGEDPKDAADRQAKIDKAVSDAANEMKDRSKKDGRENPSGKPLKSAEETLKYILKQLNRKEGEPAAKPDARPDIKPDQKKVVDDLGDAIKRIDQAIIDTVGRDQTAALARIDEMLSEILKKQRELTKLTGQTFDRRGKDGAYERKDELVLRDVSGRELALDEKTGEVTKLVKDEGTTVVFGEVLDSVQARLKQVAGKLAQQDASELTQASQREIEQTLENLIKALRDEQIERNRVRKRPPQPPQPPQPPPDQPPPPPQIVSPIAELKMLKLMQEQINKRTTLVNQQAEDGKLSTQDSRSEHVKLAEQEKLVKDMTGKLAQRAELNRKIEQERERRKGSEEKD